MFKSNNIFVNNYILSMSRGYMSTLYLCINKFHISNQLMRFWIRRDDEIVGFEMWTFTTPSHNSFKAQSCYRLFTQPMGYFLFDVMWYLLFTYEATYACLYRATNRCTATKRCISLYYAISMTNFTSKNSKSQHILSFDFARTSYAQFTA